jgi:NAD+ synthase (glutamine-hydrolysing)
VRIALAQLNPTVGDLAGNLELVLAAARQARQGGADVLVASELVISGYPPKDLLLREGFVAACDRTVDELAARIPMGLTVVVGHPSHREVPGHRVANAASVLEDGRVRATIHKMLLPNYDVFDEQRYFRPADRVSTVIIGGRRVGLHICEDAWWGDESTSYHVPPAVLPDPVALLAKDGAEVFINVSASPFELSKPAHRLQILTRHVQRWKKPFVFVNQVGGNDDLVFDGHSLVLDANGKCALSLGGFVSELKFCELDDLRPISIEPVCRESLLLDALVLGLRDYMGKSGFSDCVLGISGGVDSALACYIAARAVGPEYVHALMMPSRHSSPHSVEDARRLAENLGVQHEIIPIDAIQRAYEGTPVVSGDLASQPGGLADQNLQSRIRGALVMIRSNRYGWLPLATGNKSELAVGYCTLYGDMAGGFAVLCDVFKRDVYAVSRYINEKVEGRDVIPANTLSKAPSAELAPNQVDQDTLPPYDLLDAILEGLIERELSVSALSQHYPPDTVRWVARQLDRNEFKRRQMPPGIKLSQRAFGSGRRMPMAARISGQ